MRFLARALFAGSEKRHTCKIYLGGRERETERDRERERISVDFDVFERAMSHSSTTVQTYSNRFGPSIIM